MAKQNTRPVRRLRHAQINPKDGFRNLATFVMAVREVCGGEVDPVKYVEGLPLHTFSNNKTKARRVKKDVLQMIRDGAIPGAKPASTRAGDLESASRQTGFVRLAGEKKANLSTLATRTMVYYGRAELLAAEREAQEAREAREASKGELPEGGSQESE